MYPAGTFLQTEKGYFYVLSSTKRLPIKTQRCLDSWSPIKVIKTTETHPAVTPLKIGVPMKFRNGSLLYSQASGRFYLISQGKLRHITSPDVLEELGFTRNEAVWVSLDEINLHEKGEPLNG
jgi:hypothetical protein